MNKCLFTEKGGWLRHVRLLNFAILCLLLTLAGCKHNADPDVTPEGRSAADFNADVALQWSQMHLDLIRSTAGFTPPVAARSLGYGGLTLYEAVVPGVNGNRSLAGQLNGLATLPKPESGTYHWPASANAAQAQILRGLFANTSEANKKRIDSLETTLQSQYRREAGEDVANRSAAFGKAVAEAIFAWSKTDRGHEGYLRNFPADYAVPVRPGNWQPTENGRPPMQPFWGSNRTFLAVNAAMPIPEPIPYSADVRSQYFAQYLEVYTKNRALTQEEKEIAVWWADDPSETFTPPGHSYNLARIAIQSRKANLAEAAEALARTGIAVADAFILCWRCKYTHFNERPYTFVRRAIDPAWVPFWPAPPFPGFVSGHATQSAAAVTVLESVFGENFSFIDNSHVSRTRDAVRKVDFKARSFGSLWEAAEESAYSRFLGGIHTRQDNDTGLREGRKIGRNINALSWRN
ncbi:vanadium-dependent haloperoxidase [Tellurirhabdus rosea]|uniref:vanadium-dependent haloperoxidase n=1 Tax=Tellurirhabdus rosea TaxID=2674997 RepID=UPI002254C8B3|nr:vanadium-dependent haloperoxidase [Tellurirhabdus rosea]